MAKYPERERELVLESNQVVWVFLGIALLCGIFFALGFVVGSHTGPSDAAGESQEVTAASNEKPSALPQPTYIPRDPGTVQAATTDAGGEEAAPYQTAGAPEISPTDSTVTDPALTAAPAIAAPPIEVVEPPEGLVVQISALSRREDTEGLVALLKAKNLPVLVTTAPNDSLFHVVVGPYQTQNEAVRVKQALEREGFRPFIR
jgi:cell division septation protein DedD